MDSSARRVERTGWLSVAVNVLLMGLNSAVAAFSGSLAVTAEAVRQAKQGIRRARRENPETPIIVSGCAAQIEPETFAAMPEVTQVIGNAEKLAAATYAGLALGDVERVRVNDIMSVRETAGQLIDEVLSWRAFFSSDFRNTSGSWAPGAWSCTVPY